MATDLLYINQLRVLEGSDTELVDRNKIQSDHKITHNNENHHKKIDVIIHNNLKILDESNPLIKKNHDNHHDSRHPPGYDSTRSLTPI